MIIDFYNRLDASFFCRDVLEVAPDLIGKKLTRIFNKENIEEYIITETEAYRGEEDLACHASKGRTVRTEIMYHGGGHIYVYLIYGMYWMLNFVTENEGIPQAVLIRGLKGIEGPGKLTQRLKIDKSFNGENLNLSDRIFVSDGLKKISIIQSKRIGIDYAGEIWKNKLWRFTLID
jgi:DNA-3-methyladenine glycosylase